VVFRNPLPYRARPLIAAESRQERRTGFMPVFDFQARQPWWGAFSAIRGSLTFAVPASTQPSLSLRPETGAYLGLSGYQVGPQSVIDWARALRGLEAPGLPLV